LFENGPRPVNIRGDVRLLGFRYIGKRSRNMDVRQFMTAEQNEREIQSQTLYDTPIVDGPAALF